MAISVRLDDARQWVTAIATGTLTFAELTKFLAIHQFGDRQRWPVLLDATAANTSMSGVDAEKLADHLIAALTQTGLRRPIAITATDDSLFAVLCICQMLCEKRGSLFRVCRRPK